MSLGGSENDGKPKKGGTVDDAITTGSRRVLERIAMSPARKSPPHKAAEHEVVLESPDKVLTFRLTRGQRGVYVERVQRRSRGTFTHSAVFFARDDFASFCDADLLRFEYQLTYMQLRKTFEELLDAQDNATAKPARDGQ